MKWKWIKMVNNEHNEQKKSYKINFNAKNIDFLVNSCFNCSDKDFLSEYFLILFYKKIFIVIQQ